MAISRGTRAGGRPAAVGRAKVVGVAGAAGARAKAVAGGAGVGAGSAGAAGAGAARPPGPGASADPDALLAQLRGEDVVREIRRREGVATENAYAMGRCLRELARPARYRDEMGFARFEALLANRGLPTRMTAHK